MTPATNTTEKTLIPQASLHPAVEYLAQAVPLTVEELKTFENPPYDGSLEFEEVKDKSADSLSMLVSRFAVTSDWKTYTTYANAMDTALKWHMEYYLSQLLADHSLMPQLTTEDYANITDRLNQEIAMNGAFAGVCAYAWMSQSAQDDNSQYYDSDAESLYNRTEHYESRDLGPGIAAWVWGKNTNEKRKQSVSMSTVLGGEAYDYSDQITDTYPDGSLSEEADAQDESTTSLKAHISGSYETLDGKRSANVDVTGKYRTNPAPERIRYQVSGSAGGELAGNLISGNDVGQDARLSGSVWAGMTQNEEPSSESKMTKHSWYAGSGANYLMRFSKQWGAALDMSGSYSDWSGSYSEGTSGSGSFYLYTQYSPPEKKQKDDEEQITEKQASDTQPWLSSFKFGYGASLGDSRAQDYGVDESSQTVQAKIYNRASIDSNEKKNVTLYASLKPQVGFLQGTYNGWYPSLSTSVDLEWSPGFHSFSVGVGHYMSDQQNLEYIHTDADEDYYFEEGYYDIAQQELSAYVDASVVPCSPLNLGIWADVTQAWVSGNMAPADDLSFSTGANVAWLISKRKPHLTLELDGDYSRGLTQGNQIPTKDWRENEWSVSLSLNADYIRLPARKAKDNYFIY